MTRLGPVIDLDQQSAGGPGFTPGPWTTDGRGDIAPDDELIITGAVTRYGPGYPNHTRLAAVALVERSCNEAEDYANARLIAAAPELYAALSEMVAAERAEAAAAGDYDMARQCWENNEGEDPDAGLAEAEAAHSKANADLLAARERAESVLASVCTAEKPAEVCGPENQNPPMCTSFGWSPAEARGGEFMCWLDAIENPENPGRSVYVGEMYGNTAAEAEARADMVCRAVNGHSGLLAALALIVETKDRGGDLLAVIDAARTHLA